jgi:hypothetical protein
MLVTKLRFALALAAAIGLFAGNAPAEEQCPKPLTPEEAERLMTPAKVSVEGGTLRVDGTILEEAVAEVARLLIAAEANPIRSIVIKSHGGERVAGIHFGELVRDWKLAVTVDSYCESACANYAAIVARELVVPDGAVLGYHGGPSKSWGSDGRYREDYEKTLRTRHENMLRCTNAKSAIDLDQHIADQLRRDKEIYARQEALYRSAGVSMAILEDTWPIKIAPAHLWMFTRDVLEQCYGVKNIASYPVLPTDEIARGKTVIRVIRSCPRAGR